MKYNELKNGVFKGWIFNLDTYKTSPIDPSKFKAQCSTSCGGICDKLAKDETNLQLGKE